MIFFSFKLLKILSVHVYYHSCKYYKVSRWAVITVYFKEFNFCLNFKPIFFNNGIMEPFDILYFPIFSNLTVMIPVPLHISPPTPHIWTFGLGLSASVFEVLGGSMQNNNPCIRTITILSSHTGNTASNRIFASWNGSINVGVSQLLSHSVVSSTDRTAAEPQEAPPIITPKSHTGEPHLRMLPPWKLGIQIKNNCGLSKPLQ